MLRYGYMTFAWISERQTNRMFNPNQFEQNDLLVVLYNVEGILYEELFFPIFYRRARSR